MRVISVAALRDFWSHPHCRDAEDPLKAWYKVTSDAQWTSLQDIKNQYRNASLVAHNRAVFNIGGNKYRLVVGFAFNGQLAYVKFVGTHRAYDEIDVATVELRK